jgi:hypothetical protein
MVRAGLSVLLLSSCSILFDPSKVKCQVEPTVAPGPLDAIAGDGTSLTYEWPGMPPDAGVGGYQICTAHDMSAMAGCHHVGLEACDSGVCRFTLNTPDAGLAYNTRVWAKLLGENVCGNASNPALAPTVSITPVNGSFLDVQGMSRLTGCDAGIHADGGLLIIEQHVNGFSSCVSAAVLGDDLFENATLDVEMRTFASALAGVAARVPALDDQAQRLAVLLTPAPGAAESVAITRRPANDIDKPVATSVSAVSDGVWRALRVSLVDAGVSVALGDVGTTPSDVLRWTDPTPVAGQFGLALVGFGLVPVDVSAEFRNLRVRARAAIAQDGPTSAQWTFSGSNAFVGVRTVGMAGPATCPSAFVAAMSCPAGTCLPNAGSQCLQLDSTGGNAFASVDMPVGIDPLKPWHVKFKFAPALAGNVTNPNILRTTIAPIGADALSSFSGQPLLDINGSLWTFPIRVFGMGTDTIGTVARGEWNVFELDFDAAAGTYVAKLNGMPHNGGYPAALGPHLGALQLGGAGDLHGFYSDLEIAQP